MQSIIIIILLILGIVLLKSHLLKPVTKLNPRPLNIKLMMTNRTKTRKNSKIISSFLVAAISLFVTTSCSVLSPESSQLDVKRNDSSYDDLVNRQPIITLTKHVGSKFSQVNATFYVSKNKSDTFRVISDLSLSTQWFDRLKDIDTLAFEDNNNFVLRSIIFSPWPFQNRELITCVNTQFLDIKTIITIKNCPSQHPETKELIRIKQADSLWVIMPVVRFKKSSPDEALTKVSYQAWLEPNGNVPAFFFNQSLKTSSLKSLKKLKKLIERD